MMVCQKTCKSFCIFNYISLTNIKTFGNKENLKLLDDDLAHKFYNDHKENAILQVLKKANKKRK